MNILKNFFLLVIFLALITQCTFKKIDVLHGTAELKNKSSLLKLNLHNKNDVIKILGPLAITDPLNIDNWMYFETRLSKNMLGEKVIKKNDILILDFSKNGVISNIIFLDKDKMNEIAFDKDKTKSLGIQDTVLFNILKSTRKRLEMLSNKK